MHRPLHRIVLIEDNPADTALLRQALNEQDEAYTLEVLRDGEAAIRHLREFCRLDSPEPCLIILDLHLPRYDGVAVLREIKAHGALAHVSVAIVTSGASPDEQAAVMDLGVSLYRKKPLDWDDTLGLARELIDLCKSPQRSLAVANL